MLIARQAIDVLLKMDIERTRMRYCFTEYKEVYFLIKSVLTIGSEEPYEIMYWDQYIHTGTCKTDQC